MPLILVLGRGCGRSRRAQDGRGSALEGVPLRRRDRGASRPAYRRRGAVAGPAGALGLAYLVGRADEFHLIPLSVVLAVMLARGSGRRRRAIRVALLVALALIALHGLDRQAGQLLHPPALADVPGAAATACRRSPPTRGHCVRSSSGRAADSPGRADLRRQPAPRSGAGGRPAPVRDPRPPESHALRRDAARSGHDRHGAERDRRSLQRSHTGVVIRWLDPRRRRSSTTEPIARAACTYSIVSRAPISGRTRASASTRCWCARG